MPPTRVLQSLVLTLHALMHLLFVRERNIQWTFCPGNHDHEHNATWARADMLAIFGMPLCASADATGFDHTFTFGHTPVACAKSCVRVWVFDSGVNDAKLRFTTFNSDVVQQYVQLSQDAIMPSAVGLAFFHIPLPEYGGARAETGHHGLFDAAYNSGKVPRPWLVILRVALVICSVCLSGAGSCSLRHSTTCTYTKIHSCPPM